MKNDCVFCEKIASTDLCGYFGSVWFEPLNPVVPGHLLVVPVEHVQNFSSNPVISSRVMYVAAIKAQSLYKDYNIITSSGSAATQSMLHLHVHIVPRHDGDGLKLPWTNQPRP